MKQRVLRFGVLAILLLGLAGSAAARADQAETSGESLARGSGAGGMHRDGWKTSPPALEFLDLPRHVPLDVNAASAILLDAMTGEVLFARNPDEPRPPASLTKILTALVILERGRLTDTVLISQAATRVGGYSLGLRRGQQISLEDLLVAILIRSANDAAVAAAEHVGHGLPGFVALMNAKSQDLGLIHSNFTNPHGLDEPAHFTTARDVALLTRVAMEHPTFARLVRTREVAITIWKPGRRGPVRQVGVIQSHNKLLGRLEGADGVKTGYTEAAGQCLVASASRGGQRMIAVLLNDPQRWIDAATLLEFGFESAGDASRAHADPLRALRLAGRPRLAPRGASEEFP